MKLQIKTRLSAQRTSRFTARRRGQALIEMAFVSVILIFLSMGIIQYGIIYNSAINLTNMAREGARFAAIHGNEINVESQTEDYIRDTVASGTTIRAADIPNANIAVTTPNGQSSGNPIVVIVTYDMRKKFILPVSGWGGLADTNNRWSQYKSTATMIIE